MPSDQRPFDQLQDLAHGAPNLRHQGGGQASQWPPYEAPVIAGPELVHEQIGRLRQTSRSRDPDAKGFGIVDQARSEGNDQGGRAVALLERGVAVSREWNLSIHSVQNTGLLGYTYALSGRTAEGIPLLEHALSASEAMRHGAVHQLLLVYLGEAYALADQLEDALEVAGRALTLARERGQRPYEARALRLLAEITTDRDSLEHADGHYRDALALAEELGMRPLVAHCHLGLGKLYRRTGKRQQAQEHLTTATTMYREMDMRSWLEQAEAEEPW